MKCLGHGSGKIAARVDPDALKSLWFNNRRGRADLFGLYYMADKNWLSLVYFLMKKHIRPNTILTLMNGLLTPIGYG